LIQKGGEKFTENLTK